MVTCFTLNLVQKVDEQITKFIHKLYKPCSKGKTWKTNLAPIFNKSNKFIEWFQVDSEEDVGAGGREAMLRSLDREVPGLCAARAEVKRLRCSHYA